MNIKRKENQFAFSLLIIGLFVLGGIAYGNEYDYTGATSLNADIVGTPALNAHDGTKAASRSTTIGIGESIDLSLDLSTFKDEDRCRLDSNSPWVICYDSLGGAAYINQSPGVGSISNVRISDNKLLGSFSAKKLATNASANVQAQITDSGSHTTDRDVEALFKSITVPVIVPTGLTYNACSYPWATKTLGTTSFGGSVVRSYKISPLTVNFCGLTFQEEIPAKTITWEDGSQDTACLPHKDSTFGLLSNGIFQNDAHQLGLTKYSRVNTGTGVFSISWPGYFGWIMESGSLNTTITWTHDFNVYRSDHGVELIGNGHTTPRQGPYADSGA